MLSALVGIVVLILFFGFVLWVCLRRGRQEEQAALDSRVELMRKSPLGRWRY